MAAASPLPCLISQSSRSPSLHQGKQGLNMPCIASHTLSSTFLPAREGSTKLSHVIVRRAKKRAFQLFVQKVVSSAQKQVVMVDPIEAKRLAAEQMKQLQAKAKLKRQRTIEAINGGWAMLGLTACLVIEGYTGKTILSQVAGYLHVLADIFDDYLPISQL
eukprot:c11218_g1_i1 orf=357-839(-)